MEITLSAQSLSSLSTAFPKFSPTAFQSLTDYLIYAHSQDGELVTQDQVVSEILTGYDLETITEMLEESQDWENRAQNSA